MSTAIITTTINDLAWTEHWKNVQGDWKMYIALDLPGKPPKSPGKKFELIPVLRQMELDQMYGLDGVIPFRSVSRRNYALIRALEDHHDHILSIDDDNLPHSTHIVEEHIGKLGGFSGDSIYTRNKLFNPLRPFNLRMRGFPTNHPGLEGLTFSRRTDPIGINVGLWTNHADIDAFSYFIDTSPLIFDVDLLPEGILLSDTYMPVNTQNTSMVRELALGYFDIPTSDIPGLERYNDILGGYFLEKIAKHLGWAVGFGHPYTYHLRNPHDPLTDLRKEILGYEFVNELVEFLHNTPLQGTDVHSAYGSLINELSATFVDPFPGWNKILYRMRKWHKAMDFLL